MDGADRHQDALLVTARSWGDVTAPPLFVTPADAAGPRDPLHAAPELPDGAVRRTSVVDVAVPHGFEGPRHLTARARDAAVRAGELQVRASASVSASAAADWRLEQFATDPPCNATGLVGTTMTAGFRSRAAAAAPAHVEAATPLWTLLDDLPVASMVSGYARLRTGAQPSWLSAGAAPKADICSGWAAEASMIQLSLSHGVQPVTLGPTARAPELVDAGSWPDVGPLRPHSVRRRRRLDVVPDGDALNLDAWFRDAHGEDSGGETVIHEYSVFARVGATDLVLREIAARPRVLPFVECPVAAASPQRLVGRSLVDVRAEVRSEFLGTSTCTHLNDLLRSLQDVVGLRTLL